MPLPESDTLRLGSEALELTLRVPFAVPLAVGANTIESDVLWPAARVLGAVPLRLNPGPATET